jgi:Domain of unknown function (DUF4359)
MVEQSKRANPKSWKGKILVLILGALGLGAVGLGLTNPTEQDYEQYAAQELQSYLRKNVCKEAPQEFDLRARCEKLVGENEPALRRIIADRTERVEFYLFSLYLTELNPTDLIETRLPIASFLPTYRIEAVGFAKQFKIYQAKEK